MKTLLLCLFAGACSLVYGQEDVFTISKTAGRVELYPTIDTLACGGLYSFLVTGLDSSGIGRLECLKCRVTFSGDTLSLVVDSANMGGRNMLNPGSYKDVPSSNAPLCILKVYSKAKETTILSKNFYVRCAELPARLPFLAASRSNWLQYAFDTIAVKEGDVFSKSWLNSNKGFAAWAEKRKSNKKVPYVVQGFRVEVATNTSAGIKKFGSYSNRFSRPAIKYLQAQISGTEFRIRFTAVHKAGKYSSTDVYQGELLNLKISD